ncbi:UDP-glucose 4-epimerase GalE [Algivirga pacifica]|uniref:UDP-glucose 4-epimerase n=1 Tax=Algivirga pacifica TaxID=1162670 RepID=A0ABP9D856_9BACT
MKKILVTGGTGYIGSHTVVALQQKGYEVVVLDNLSNSEYGVLDGIERITGVRPTFENVDLRDKERTAEVFQSHTDIKAVIHFAASKAVGESVGMPLEYYENNIGGMLNLLSAMRTYKVPNIVFSSSCTVYGQPKQLPVTEEEPVKPALSPYGNTKQIGEEILRDTVKAHPGLKAISLRYFNPVGAHESALIGELPKGVPLNLLPFITQTAIGLREQLKVYGKDYNTVDGTCVRDYIHVVDLANAHIIAAERMLDHNGEDAYEYFNLGTGTGSSVLQVIQAFEKVSGQALNYVFVERRAGDVEQIWADTQRANEVLGWKAEKGLEEMVRTAWLWEQHVRKQVHTV